MEQIVLRPSCCTDVSPCVSELLECIKIGFNDGRLIAVIVLSACGSEKVIQCKTKE